MEFNQLKTFIKVAQLLSFSNAAEALGYSQSAVTVHIQLLEKELETSLFERMGRKVYLTDAGRLFLTDAMEIMKQVEEAKFKLKTPDQPTGSLRIGTVDSLGTTIVPKILLQLHDRYPEINTVVSIGTTKELQHKMKHHEIDMMFTLDYLVYGSEWVKIYEQDEDSVFVGSLDYLNKLPSQPQLSDIIQQPFILTQEGVSYRRELEVMLATEECQLMPELELANPETILQLLSKGFGLSFLPRFVVEHGFSLGGFDMIECNVPLSNIKAQLIHHKDKQMTGPMEAFSALLIDYYKQRQ